MLLLSVVGGYAQNCPSAVTITTPDYATTLTQSNSWVKMSSNALATASVKLDADPVNGYVELNPGFMANPGSLGVFIAQPLDGCGAGVPSKVMEPEEQLKVMEWKNDKVYLAPNPNKGIFVLVLKEVDKGLIEVFDLLGKKVYQRDFTNRRGGELEINIEKSEGGVYIVRLTSDSEIMQQKIIKL